MGGITTYTYNKVGNALSRTDENGVATEYTYDALYRQTSRTDKDGTASYTFDKAGNLLTAADQAGTVGFAYDALSRTTAVTNENGTTTGYAYDANGNRLSITYPDGKAVTTAYDLLGNVTALADHDGKGIAYTRDAAGKVIKEAHSDGSTTEYDYNAAGLLTQQKEVDNRGTTRREILYGYDDAGNLKSEQRTGVDFDRRDENVRYTYDSANQLTQTTVEGVSVKYQYDLAGNLLDDGKYTYTYDLQNRLLTKAGTDGTTTYTYDAAGNLLKKTAPDGLSTYEYTAQNKLKKGTNPRGETSEYSYNALGARVQNIQIRGNANFRYANALLDNGSRFMKDYMAALSDGRNTWQPTWETEVGTTVQNATEKVTKNHVADYLSVANRDIMVESEGQYTQRNVYDHNSKRISAELTYAAETQRGEPGENIASDKAVALNKVWYRTSHLDSTLFAVNASGAVVYHAIYDAWGNPQTDTKTDLNFTGLDNRNNYTGYTWDVTLGLYFAQNRFYDAENHRFTQEDPVKDGDNWYGYCGNNPGIYVDSDGRAFFLVTAGIGAAIGGLVGGVTAAVKSHKETGKINWKKTVKSVAVGAVAGAVIGSGAGLIGAAASGAGATATLALAAKGSSIAVGATVGGTLSGAVTAGSSYGKAGKIDLAKTTVNALTGAISGAAVGSSAGRIVVGAVNGVASAISSVATDNIDNLRGQNKKATQITVNAVGSFVVSGVIGAIGGSGAAAPYKNTATYVSTGQTVTHVMRPTASQLLHTVKIGITTDVGVTIAESVLSPTFELLKCKIKK